MRRGGPRRAIWLWGMALAAASTLSMLIAASSAAAGIWTPATAPLTALSPGADSTNPAVVFGKVVGGAATDPAACPAAGSCVAVGNYDDASGHLQGLIETQSGGTWTAETAPTSNLTPAAGSNPSVYFYAVSCPAAGSCVAVGSYDDASFNQYGLIETLSNGTWTSTTAPMSTLSPAPATDPFVSLTGLACPTTSWCVAIGAYNDSSPSQDGLIETLSSGNWTAQTAPLSGLSTATRPDSLLLGLSCPATGACVAGGQYQDSSNNYQGLIETLSNGAWAATAAPTTGLSPSAGTDPEAFLSDVSCPSSTSWCVAVGAYAASSGTQGLIETLSNGTWAATTAPTSGLSPAAGSPPVDPLATVSCPAIGSCVAVSTYQDASGNTQGLMETLSSGTWSPTTAPTSGLSLAAAADPTVTIGGQACSAVGSCVAVGSYTDTSGYQQGLIETLSGGTWTAETAPTSALSPTAGTNPQVTLTGLSCPATGSCTAVGSYENGSSGQYGLIETQSAPSLVTCTWTDGDHAVNDNWSNGANWSGTGCTGSGGPPAGAAIVFPSGLSVPTVIYDSGVTASSFDSITFAGQYTVSEGSGAPLSITLDPTAATPCGSSTTIAICDFDSTPRVVFVPGAALGSSGDEIASVRAGSLFLEGVISGSSLVIGDPGNTGLVFLEPGGAGCSASNTYAGPTTVGGGSLYLPCPNSVPSGTAVTVNSGAVLMPELLATGTIANNITDDGTIDAATWTSSTQTLAGTISGSGTFNTTDAASSGTTVLSGNNTYSGGTTVAPGTTLLDAPASAGYDPLGARAGAVTVDHDATLALDNGGNQMSVSNPLTVGDGTAGTALVVDQAIDTWTGAVTLVSGTTDELADSGGREWFTVTGVIGGSGTLTSGDATNNAFVILDPGGAGSCTANTYSGGTVVVGMLEAYCPAAPGQASTAVTIDPSGRFFWMLSSSASASYQVIDNGAYYIYPGTGTTTTLTGNVSGSGSILASGDMGSGATTVLAGIDDPAGGTVVAPNGNTGTTLDVTGSIGAVTVYGYCTLQGTGTVGAITSAGGTVQPGPAPGNLTTSAGATLASGGTGSLSVDITGGTVGTGYSQLSSTSTVNLGSANLNVTDAYAAPYGTVFTIVSSSGSGTPISGTFSGDPGGTVITTAGGRRLQVGYSSNAVTLTDVTNPSSPPTGPTVGGISPAAGPTGGGTSVTVTGTGFTGATAVAFGSTPAASFKVVSGTEITAVSPAGISGVVDVEVTTPSGTSAAAAADQFSYQADFTGVAPSRICDTRSGNPSALSGGAAQCDGRTLTANTPLTVNVRGLGGVPGTGASAVVLNVTVTNPTAGGYLTVYPAGQSAPLASNLNFSAGETVANLVEVGLGQGGQIAVVTNVKSADVIVDVEGYVSALPTAGGLYDGLTPTRICDTRASSLPVNQCTGKTMKPNSTMAVQVAGLGGVPAQAEAVAVNVTATGTTAAGYLTVFPSGTPPTASNLNWASGQTVPNLVVVELNSSGGITLYNHAGTTDVVLDVLGYYTAAGGSGTQFNALTKPVRICDSRSGSQPSNQCTGKTMAQNGTMAVQVTGLAGVPADAQAVVLNVTATNTFASGYLTVYPGGTRPLASNLNWTSGQTVPNLVIARLGSSGQITLYNFAGSTDVIVDVMGWYS